MNVEKVIEFLTYLTFALGVLGLGLIASASLLIIGWVIGLGFYNSIVLATTGAILSGGFTSFYLHRGLILPLKQPMKTIRN